jgi:hypothetical protein
LRWGCRHFPRSPTGEARHYFAQQFDPFARKIVGLQRQPGDVAARPRQVPDQAGAERIAGQGEYDWYRGCGPFRCQGKRISRKDNDIDFEADQFGRYLGGTLSTSLGPPVFDRHSMAFAPSEVAQLLHESGRPLALNRRRVRS